MGSWRGAASGVYSRRAAGNAAVEVFYALTVELWTANGFLALDEDAGTIAVHRMRRSPIGTEHRGALTVPPVSIRKLIDLLIAGEAPPRGSMPTKLTRSGNRILTDQ